MKTTDFNFNLPNEQIARIPTKERTQSRLLSLNGETGDIEHQHFIDIEKKLNPNDLLIMNDTRVIAARLYGNKETGGKIEVLIERILDKNQALAQIKSNKAIKTNTKIIIENSALTFEIIEKKNNFFIIQFNNSVLEVLEKFGHIPLPPYLNRDDQALDYERYQTVYAKNNGAVAAPTAGLHFDRQLLDRIKSKGIQVLFITLHVGAGTFQPIRVENILHHKMHSEYIEVSNEVCDAINETKKNGGRVVAIGTTTLRSLETAYHNKNEIQPFVGETDIFIYPGFKFQAVDILVTNFHLPQSTLLMLVSAFSGRKNILKSYKNAVKLGYRFFSYGDAMWLTKTPNYKNTF